MSLQDINFSANTFSVKGISFSLSVSQGMEKLTVNYPSGNKVTKLIIMPTVYRCGFEIYPIDRDGNCIYDRSAGYDDIRIYSTIAFVEDVILSLADKQ